MRIAKLTYLIVVTRNKVQRIKNAAEGHERVANEVNSRRYSYIEGSLVGDRLCVRMAMSMALKASLASQWRRIIRLITRSARA